MEVLYIPLRPAKTHQIIARQILINLTNKLDLKNWQPIQEAALRDDDEKSLSADITVFDKEETAKVCIEIFKKPFSDNAKRKRYEELIDYYPDLQEIFLWCIVLYWNITIMRSKVGTRSHLNMK